MRRTTVLNLTRIALACRAISSSRCCPHLLFAGAVLCLAGADDATAATAKLDPLPDRAIHQRNPVLLKGRGAAGQMVVLQARNEAGEQIASWSRQANEDGSVSFSLDRTVLPDGHWLKLRARSGDEGDWSEEMPFFVHPVIDGARSLPMISAQGRDLLLDGRPWGFVGLNYTRFLIEFSIRSNSNFERMVDEVRTHADWGVKLLRVPLNLSMFQPARGVFPDDPRYRDILRSHGLRPDFYELFEYFLSVCGHYGIRVSLEWHELPNDPYRYFVGGNFQDKGTGKPGTAISWLFDREADRAAEPGDEEFIGAIVDTNAWLAKRFRGNGNILGFESPYNEPHSLSDSSDRSWRELAAAAARAIVLEDPDRLVFGMTAGWGHNNVLPSVTWRLPDLIHGLAPHYYLGNGPVATRDDAPQRKEPWLARNIDETFSYSFAAVAMPHSAAPYPVWNGESGEHGYSSFLPEMDRFEASSLMVESQLVQAYAAGFVGSVGWTLTGHETVYDPMREIYGAQYQRFSPVFEAGPVNYHSAEVLFVQNPGAEPIENALNYACVPFAKLALDLHLSPAHYMTDDQLLSEGAQISVGLEQVEEADSRLSYKAAVVDARNLDSRALSLLEGSGMAILVTENPRRLTREALTEFLKGSGVSLDLRTPPELQMIVGPEHVIVYRRSGYEQKSRVYPRVSAQSPFDLVDEQGATVFSGTANQLEQDGLAVDLPVWRSAIYKIETKRSTGGSASAEVGEKRY